MPPDSATERFEISIQVQAADKEEPGELRIASVEVSRDIASVKVVEDYPQSR